LYCKRIQTQLIVMIVVIFESLLCIQRVDLLDVHHCLNPGSTSVLYPGQN